MYRSKFHSNHSHCGSTTLQRGLQRIRASSRRATVTRARVEGRGTDPSLTTHSNRAGLDFTFTVNADSEMMMVTANGACQQRRWSRCSSCLNV